MTDSEDDHDFAVGQGFEEPYEGFDLEPPELKVDPDEVDPVDSRVITDLLDQRNLGTGDVDVDSLIDVGLEYVQINRFEEAIDALERAITFSPPESLQTQEALTNKGVAHAQLEEWDEAIGAYESALRIDDGSEYAAVAETNLAYALWESGQHDRALEHAELAVEIDERLPQAWFNRGFFLNERGLAEEAQFCLDNAERLGLQNAELYEEKAQALEALGEYDEAAEAREQAEELVGPDEEAIKE